MMYTIMRECSATRLDCLCDTKPVGPKNKFIKTWKAVCVSHYTHSVNLTKRILDKVFENSKDLRGLMNHHNLRAGRVVSKFICYENYGSSIINYLTI